MYPKFRGKVSLFCHSLGSVIAFDLLWNQEQARANAQAKALAKEQPPCTCVCV
jgi:hypothetical protein